MLERVAPLPQRVVFTRPPAHDLVLATNNNYYTSMAREVAVPLKLLTRPKHESGVRKPPHPLHFAPCCRPMVEQEDKASCSIRHAASHLTTHSLARPAATQLSARRKRYRPPHRSRVPRPGRAERFQLHCE
jgi:hypothetical protein